MRESVFSPQIRGVLDRDQRPLYPIIPGNLQETIDWLVKIEDFPTARSLARTVFKYLPQTDPMATDFLASTLQRCKYYKEAAAAAQQTLQLVPDSVEARFNAAKCLNSAGQPDQAERLMRQVVEARPDWVDPQIDLAVYICLQGRRDEAQRMLESILPRLNPSDRNVAVVQFNLGWHEIRCGNFKKGMQWLGIGRVLRIWGAMTHQFSFPVLHAGADVRGKKILLCGEGGAGDEMINVRFAQTIEDRGGQAVWLSSHGLDSLFARVPGVDRVVKREELSRTFFDYWAPCMDLPRILDLDWDEIPQASYLTPHPQFVQKWRARLRDSRRLKVGLRWQGNALYEQDLMRSVPFKLLEQLLDLQHVDFYSLQRDEGSEERPQDSPVMDWGSDLKTWEDTAGAIANLDLVITSCTSVAHLAAAMGKPTWIFCPLNCYYIWATPGSTSPWYPSVRLFRQERLHDWQGPLDQIRGELQQFLISRS